MAGCLREHLRFDDGEIEDRDSPNGLEAVRRQSALRVEKAQRDQMAFDLDRITAIG
jgi:hypothetical protein